MTKKYLLLSLEDQRIKSIAEILSNKTSNRIISLLSEKEEASQNDISKELKIPLNTVDYNIKKMIKADIIEETKNFFWSPKGRKIKMYKFSNKSIVIAPKNTKLSSEIKQILPVALVSGLAAVAIKVYFSAHQTVQNVQQDAYLFATEASAKTAETTSLINSGNYSLWFLGGALFAIALIVIKIALYERSWSGKSK